VAVTGYFIIKFLLGSYDFLVCLKQWNRTAETGVKRMGDMARGGGAKMVLRGIGMAMEKKEMSSNYGTV
jgi:hypothetical protein